MRDISGLRDSSGCALQVPSVLAPEVQKLMKQICDINMMAKTLEEIGYDAKKMPLGKVRVAICRVMPCHLHARMCHTRGHRCRRISSTTR